MKITFVTGSYPPDVCGVGGYTSRLAEALGRQGVRTEVVHDEDWRVTNVGRIQRRIRSLRSDLVHIQYPTIGFGTHLSPQLLSVLMPCIVTLHEISQTHILRRLSLYPFTLRSPHVIITTDYDRDYALAWAPWIRGRSSVIPVGSNIAVRDSAGKATSDDIVYFGLIRPDRGIEDVLALAALIRDRGLPYVLRMAGKPLPNSGEYLASLQAGSKGLPVIWDIGRSDDGVAELLAGTRIAYMPFPDGASERRTSLFALLAYGVPTVTTKGAATPEAMEGAVAFSRHPQDALAAISRILSDREYCEGLSAGALAYSRCFTWETIAIQHRQLYEQLLMSR